MYFVSKFISLNFSLGKSIKWLDLVFETAMFLLIQLFLLVLELSNDKRYFVPTDFFPLHVLLQFYGQLFVDIDFEQLSLRFVCCPYLPLSGFNMGKKSRRQC